MAAALGAPLAGAADGAVDAGAADGAVEAAPPPQAAKTIVNDAAKATPLSDHFLGA